MERGYQYGYSDKMSGMFDLAGRQKKAMTMISVFSECIGSKLDGLSVLDVGGSAGVIDEYLARHFGHVTGIDIDKKAIAHANNNFNKKNLSFEFGDAMNLSYRENSFDVVICSHVYEHVPCAYTLMSEIYRVLKPGGVVYFAAGNKLMFKEPHYNLPLLSLFPLPMANLYLVISGKGSFYYEKFFTYWGLKKLVYKFNITDYTKAILLNPEKFNADYMVLPGSRKHKVAVFIAKYLFWLMPSYVWILTKPINRLQ